METIGMRIWKMVVFADFLSGNPCFILTHAGMLMQCHEAKVIVKPKSDVQSPKVKTKRTSADTKITWDTTPPDGITSIVSTIWLHFMKKLLWSRYGLYESIIGAVRLPLKNLDAHPSVGEPAAQHIVELV